MRIVVEVVIPINPTRGVATFNPTAILRSGIARSASPNPNVDRVNVAIKIIGNITI